MTTFVRAKDVIVTSFIYPPIPIRSMDWQATFDDYDGAPDAGWQCHGSGRTELDAVYEMYCDWETMKDIGDELCAHRPMFKEDL